MYEAPVPALSRYEPTGTFMTTARNSVSYTNDGRNWQRAEWTANDDFNVTDQWEFATNKMVIPGSVFFGQFAFRMTNTNPVEFEISADPPSPPDPGEENDEYHPSFRLSHGTGGFIGTSSQTIRSSGDAEFWNEELPVPNDFGDAGLGKQVFMPEVGLHIRLGAGEFSASAGNYWTSGNGTGWTERVFPEPFDEGIANNTATLVGNGDNVVLVGLRSNGRIYRSFDGVDWSLRFDPFPEESVRSIVWNPQANNGAGAFFATMIATEGNPNNLLTSPDGTFWNPVDPNDLPQGDFSLASDTGKNLMIARQDLTAFEPELQNGGYWMSDDDGETWKEFGDRRGGFVSFIDLKIGPVVDETLFIDTGPIVISDSRNNPDTANASLQLRGFNTELANEILEFTSRTSTISLGKWAAAIDTLNPFYYQIRLDRISGDDFAAFSRPINEWIDFNTSNTWRYLLDSGVDAKTFSGTLRIRDKETLVESNSVSVSITATVVIGADLSGVAATSAVGTVGFVPHGEAAISGVEATTAISPVGVNIVVDLTGVEATPAVGTVTAT
jgi:hypothetical protein